MEGVAQVLEDGTQMVIPIYYSNITAAITLFVVAAVTFLLYLYVIFVM